MTQPEPAHEQKFLIDVCIPTLSEESTISDTLSELTWQTLYRKGKVQIVLADYDPLKNNSAALRKVVEKTGIANVKIVSADRAGVGYQRNVAALACKAPYMVSFDADCRYRDDNALELLLEPLVPKYTNTDAGKKVRIPEALMTHGDIMFVEGRLNPNGIQNTAAKLLSSSSRYLPIACAPCCMHNKEVYMAIGGYMDMPKVPLEDFQYALRLCYNFSIFAKKWVNTMVITSDRRAVEFDKTGFGIFDYSNNYRLGGRNVIV